MVKQHASVGHSRHADASVAADDEVDCWPVSTQQGHAFEVNNGLPHKVSLTYQFAQHLRCQ